MTGAIKRIVQWSFSLWKTYNTCPRKVKLNKLDGIREPGSPQMDRGNAIHKLAEDFIRLKQKKLPQELVLYKKEFAKLSRLGDEVKVEEEWAFTKQWKVTQWKACDAWVRLKMDAYYVTATNGKMVMTIIDYKTGKVYEDNKKQLSFYALAGFLRNPLVDKVNVELWYLDQGPQHTHRDSYLREEVEDMKAAWESATAQLLYDTVFAPRPGYYCKFCYYSKSKSGHCEF